jgi:hypothetical protein
MKWNPLEPPLIPTFSSFKFISKGPKNNAIHKVGKKLILEKEIEFAIEGQ